MREYVVCVILLEVVCEWLANFGVVEKVVRQNAEIVRNLWLNKDVIEDKTGSLYSIWVTGILAAWIYMPISIWCDPAHVYDGKPTMTLFISLSILQIDSCI